MNALQKFYKGKTVLVTGHTGFKGAWLSLWLYDLGARVVGYSLNPPSTPSQFEVSGLASRVIDVRGDVRDFDGIKSVLSEHRPQIVFHMAAQSLVRRSYREPRLTFETNVSGTVNVLDAALGSREAEAVICVTSDKCYEPGRLQGSHREDDRLGGRDAYSASKACAELVANVYRDAEFQENANPKRTARLPISSVRAGNVIGGGDWAEDRLVPDVVRAVSSENDVIVRNPDAIRPWQHVLEPLSGYLWLALLMVRDPNRFASSYNFGPRADEPAATVVNVVESMLATWVGSRCRMIVRKKAAAPETRVLRLDSTRAEQELQWSPVWRLQETIDHTAAWYRRFYESRGPMFDYSVDQIHVHTREAREKDLAWAAES